MFSSNVAFEELVLRSLEASSLIKPLLTPGGWQEEKCVYWKVSVCPFEVRSHVENGFFLKSFALIYTFIIHQIFSLAHDWSKRVT